MADGIKDEGAALNALLAYQQADMDGIMVTTSRQAIHEVAAELTALREFRFAVLSHIPMEYLRRHSPAGATGPTSETDVEAAMRDYSEDRWKLIDRVTALRALNAELVGDIQTLIKYVPDQNWNQMEDKEAFYEVVEKYNPTLAQPENSFRSRAKGEK